MAFMWDYMMLGGGWGWIAMSLLGLVYVGVVSLIFSYTFWWAYMKIVKKK